MEISLDTIQQLRSTLGVGVMDAKKALQDAGGDMNKAEAALKAKGVKAAEKRADKTTKEGLIGHYIHTTGKEGAIIAIACETDFVARTDDFKQLAHDIAMHVVAAQPKFLSPEEVPAAVLEEEEAVWKEQLASEKKPQAIIENILKGKREKFFSEVCLLKQPFVKDDSQTIEALITSYISKLGENIQLKGFSLLYL